MEEGRNIQLELKMCIFNIVEEIPRKEWRYAFSFPATFTHDSIPKYKCI